MEVLLPMWPTLAPESTSQDKKAEKNGRWGSFEEIFWLTWVPEELKLTWYRYSLDRIERAVHAGLIKRDARRYVGRDFFV